MNSILIMDKNSELSNCTFIKTVLMISMVLYHSLLFWNGSWFTVLTPERLIPVFNITTTWLNSFHIYGFTLVSGYLFYFVKYDRGGTGLQKFFLERKYFA